MPEEIVITITEPTGEPLPPKVAGWYGSLEGVASMLKGAARYAEQEGARQIVLAVALMARDCLEELIASLKEAK
jgi:hypothetical protein